MNEQTRLLLDYQEMAILDLKEQVAKLTKENKELKQKLYNGLDFTNSFPLPSRQIPIRLGIYGKKTKSTITQQ